MIKKPKIKLLVFTDSVGAIQFKNGRLITSCSQDNNKVKSFIKRFVTNNTIISKNFHFHHFLKRIMFSNTTNYVVKNENTLNIYTDIVEAPCSYKYVTTLKEAILDSAKKNPKNDIYILCDKITFEECECIADEIIHFESYKNAKSVQPIITFLKLDYEKWIIYKTEENENSATNYLMKI